MSNHGDEHYITLAQLKAAIRNAELLALISGVSDSEYRIHLRCQYGNDVEMPRFDAHRPGTHAWIIPVNVRYGDYYE